MEFRTFLLVLLCWCCFVNGQGQWREFFRRALNVDPIPDEVTFRKSYDFIIVGAGSGGSVVANRLTENPNWDVLLLEAGQDESFLTDVPLTAALSTATSYNWGYKSERLPTACLGLKDQRCNIPRGKALGGTSVINFLLYTRGHHKDFEEWASLGNPGWKYHDVLPYFIKSENCSLCEEIDEPFHGKQGYLNIEHPRYFSPIAKQFLKAGQDFGYKNIDPNGRYGLGFSRVQATMRNGARCSAAKAYLRPVKDRPNLHISVRSRVTKILVDPRTKEAIGVEFIKNKCLYQIKAEKEVILSAGTMNSPQLLMLSGIGPKEELERHGIPVIANLKVGYNLQDHVQMPTLAFLLNDTITVSDNKVQNPLHIYNYLVNGQGPFTIPGGAEALAFVKTKYAKKNDDYPDIEFVLGAGALNGDAFGTLRNILGITNSFYEKVYGPWRNRGGFSIAPVLLRPKSTGRILLKDKNPLHWPIYSPNYFSQHEDLATLVEGIKMAIQLATSRNFAKFNTVLNPIPFPDCESYTFGSDSYWACSVRHYATTLGHQVGTCKMGPSSDPSAVVDPELRLYGIKGLRVVDGSIMPNIVAGHTNAVIMMIGEKASDLIKKTWYNK